MSLRCKHTFEGQPNNPVWNGYRKAKFLSEHNKRICLQTYKVVTTAEHAESERAKARLYRMLAHMVDRKVK